MNDFASLIRFSESLGTNPLLAPGTSGNTSVKIDGVMWIKASGKSLRNAARQETFVPVDLLRVYEALDSGRELTPSGDYRTSLRPSVETWTHAFLPQKVVAHLHAINTVAWAIRADAGRGLWERLNGLRWVWVPYALSGPELGRAVRAASKSQPQVLVLANHGLVVAADDFASATALVEEVERRLTLPVRAGGAPNVRALQNRIDLPGWQIPVNPTLHIPGTDACSFERTMAGDLYPCHTIYLRPQTGVLDGVLTVSEAIRRHEATTGLRPRILLAPAEGVLLDRDLDWEAHEQLDFLAEVLARTDAGTALRTLTSQQMVALIVAGYGAGMRPEALAGAVTS